MDRAAAAAGPAAVALAALGLVAVGLVVVGLVVVGLVAVGLVAATWGGAADSRHAASATIAASKVTALVDLIPATSLAAR
jgi:hypothetical protein